jgi:hypothetical protein
LGLNQIDQSKLHSSSNPFVVSCMYRLLFEWGE